MDLRTLPTALADVIDCMHDGLFLVGPDGRILLVNEALLQLTGYTRDEVVGRPCTLFRCSACKDQLRSDGQHWCELFRTGSEVRRRTTLHAKDGHAITVLKSSSVVRDDDGIPVATVANVTDIEDLVAAERRIVDFERKLEDTGDFAGMVGRSEPMRHLFALVEKAAASDATVIIHGESGVGKELVASAIHRLGPRADRPFVQFNCAAFNDALLESELFGHVRGSFTGADQDRTGRFEQARDGSLFLDEVGDIPLPTQVKLLRVLESRRFERVGDNRPLPMDARLISATNQDLERLVHEGSFRRDFYFRINVVPLRVPALRERREDVPLLVDHFVGRLREQTGRDIVGLTPDAMERLLAHDWPGNVRELRSVLEYAFVVCASGKIQRQHLPRLVRAKEQFVRAAAAGATRHAVDDADLSADEREQRAALVDALRITQGNKSAAARVLGVTRVTVLNRMRKYGVDFGGLFG